ncbi:hypothetical protein [Rhizosphaericola mali]|uniref:Uncharacterized protein n=1 Tax=Rhizosphaericola mali TaxID=2545455 RepID=A0A5P2G3D0_9BACT|nr:hypothetical protein [Rhizosphaericola mali]QES87603.1 hypothetical protein E0W69_002610 [Rhizosphaericola mali]
MILRVKKAINEVWFDQGQWEYVEINSEDIDYIEDVSDNAFKHSHSKIFWKDKSKDPIFLVEFKDELIKKYNIPF